MELHFWAKDGRYHPPTNLTHSVKKKLWRYLWKYTNPARGILDFCKQKFSGPSNSSNKPYQKLFPQKSEQEEQEEELETGANLKKPPPLREGPN